MKKEKDSEHSRTMIDLEKKIIENLVDLQKVHINMADKFDKLAREISGLLNLFEVAARSFAQQPANMAMEKDKAFLEKIDRLLEQNKTIAKGLTLVEEKMRERIYGSHQMHPSNNHQQERHHTHRENERPEREEKKSSEEEKIQIGSRPLPRL